MSADWRFDPLVLPFSDDELRTAFRVIMTDAESEEFLADLRAVQTAEIRRRAEHQTNSSNAQEPEANGQAPAFGLGLQDDILAILSLLSDDLEKRVATYVSFIEGRDMSRDEEWQARRNELRSWVATRLKELGLASL